MLKGSGLGAQQEEKLLRFKNQLQALLENLELCVTPSNVVLEEISNFGLYVFKVIITISPTIIIGKQFAISPRELEQHTIHQHLFIFSLVHAIQNEANQLLQRIISEEIKNKIQEIRETREYAREAYIYRNNEHHWYRNEQHYQHGINEYVRKHLRYYHLEYLELLENRTIEPDFVQLEFFRKYVNPIDLIDATRSAIIDQTLGHFSQPQTTQPTSDCQKCRYFDNNPYLKCAVNPTSNGISCKDFTQKKQ